MNSMSKSGFPCSSFVVPDMSRMELHCTIDDNGFGIAMR